MGGTGILRMGGWCDTGRSFNNNNHHTSTTLAEVCALLSAVLVHSILYNVAITCLTAAGWNGGAARGFKLPSRTGSCVAEVAVWTSAHKEIYYQSVSLYKRLQTRITAHDPWRTGWTSTGHVHNWHPSLYHPQGAPWSWKDMEFRKTIFQAWKVMENKKVMENDDKVIHGIFTTALSNSVKVTQLHL